MRIWGLRSHSSNICGCQINRNCILATIRLGFLKIQMVSTLVCLWKCVGKCSVAEDKPFLRLWQRTASPYLSAHLKGCLLLTLFFPLLFWGWVEVPLKRLLMWVLTIAIKIQTGSVCVYVEMNMILKFTWKSKRPRIGKTVLQRTKLEH